MQRESGSDTHPLRKSTGVQDLKGPIVADTADKIAIKCKCGGKFRVPAAARGKRIKCPKCAGPIAIPAAPLRRTAAPKPVARPADDGGGLLDALAGHEAAAVAAPMGPALSNLCPNCTGPLAADAVVCVGCGYNVKTGKLMGASAPALDAGKAAKSLGKATAGAAGAAARSAGQFGIAVALSAAGATVGGVVWYFVAIGTNRQFGIIAILVGFLSGLGMMMGIKRPSAFGGVLAILLAFCGIFGAKFAMGAVFAERFREEMMPEEDPYRSALTTVLTEKAFKDQKIPLAAARQTPAGEDPLKYKPTDAEAGDEDEEMSFEEFARLLEQETVYTEKYNEIEQEVLEMPMDEVRRQVEANPKAMAEVKVFDVALKAVGIFIAFSLIDILWFILAGSAAWKAATGSTS